MWGERPEKWPRIIEPRACPALWDVIEAQRSLIAGAMQVEAMARPVMAFASAPAIAQLANFGEGETQKAALCDADWAPYARELQARGAACAETGAELEAWFELLELYKTALLECPSLVGSDARAAASELAEFVLWQVGQGYVAARVRPGSGVDISADLFVELFHNNPAAMLVYRFEDRSDLGSFRLVVANAEAARVSGPRLFAQVGKTLRQTAPDMLNTDVPAHYAAAVDAGESRTWATTPESGPLAHTTYETRCFPIGGDYVGVVYRDITERRRMEKQAQRHIAELERSNAELDAFAYAASHDLKAPLQDVKTLSAWIAEDLGGTLPPKSARHMQVLLDRLGRMERLLDDLLTYSRAGRERMPVEEFTLRELFEEEIALISVPPGFTFQVAANAGTLRTPKAPLAQVVRNLLGNAIKHHDRDQGSICLEASESGDRVQIAVIDDGPGIAPEFHERVFRIFQTLRPRDEVEGSGVGLAIVKKVVESHGGSVAVESRGRGTTVRFSWPKESST
jgi:signal transduction histidine kinase